MLDISFFLQTALSAEHFLGSRMLEVKIATPKVEFVITNLCYISFCSFHFHDLVACLPFFPYHVDKS